MLINMMKPQPFSAESMSYNLGVSTKSNLIDQKRNIVQLLPGYHTVITIIPQLMGTSDQFDAMDVSSRKCKLPQETDGLNLINSYTRIGCEFECAVEKAVSLCRCMPWYYTNNFTGVPICDMFGGNCFEQIMSDETYYKQCPGRCMEDCIGMPMIVVKSFLPININEACKAGSFLNHHFIQSSRQQFPFESYERLATGDDGGIADLTTSKARISNEAEFFNMYVLTYISLTFLCR